MSPKKTPQRYEPIVHLDVPLRDYPGDTIGALLDDIIGSFSEVEPLKRTQMTYQDSQHEYLSPAGVLIPGELAERAIALRAKMKE